MARSIRSWSVSQSIAMLIGRENIPNVSIITGNDSIFKIGFKIILAAASIAPAIIRETRFPVNTTPFIVHADIRIAREFANAHITNCIEIL